MACGMVYPRLFELIPVLFLGSMMDHFKNLQPLEWGFVYLERSDICYIWRCFGVVQKRSVTMIWHRSIWRTPQQIYYLCYMIWIGVVAYWDWTQGIL